jgi:hypothetical protein
MERAKVNAAAEARVDAAGAVVRDKEAEIETLREEFQRALTMERANAREKYERQRSAYDFLEKTLAENECELECERRGRGDAERARDEFKSSLSSCEDAFKVTQSECEDIKARLSSTHVECERLRSAEADLTRELREARDAYTESIAERADLERLLRDAETARGLLDDDRMKLEREFEQQLDHLAVEIERRESEASRAIAESVARQDVLERRLETRIAETERERLEMIESYESRIKAMEIEHEALCAHSNANFDERLNDVQDAHARETAEAENAWKRKEMTWLDTKRHLEADISSANARQSESDALLTMYETRQRALTSEIEELKASMRSKDEAFEAQRRESAVRLRGVESLAHKLEKELGERILEFESEKNAAAHESSLEITRLNRIWERKTSDHVEEALKEARQTHERELRRLTSEMEERTRGQVTRAVANVTEAYHDTEQNLRQELEQLKRDHAETLSNHQRVHATELASATADFESRLAITSSAHATEVERLTKSHAERLAFIHDEHEINLKRSMSEAVRLAVAEVEAQHEVRVADFTQKADASKATELKRANDDFSKELAHLEREYETKLESCITVSTALELERESLRGQLRRAREELGASEKARSVEGDKSREALSASALAHDIEIEAMRKEHATALTRMRDTAETAARVANNTLAASQAETSKWRVMYETREARPEDLRKIAELESALEDANTRLDRSAAHRRTLQAEILSRASEFEASAPASHRVGGVSLRRAQAAYAVAPSVRR